jgi:DNA-binding FadR family transcriptional regulator
VKSAENSSRTSERIHHLLRTQILGGEREPGEKLPSERTLAAELAVSRPAVREALKRLEQAGLVRISHGGATEVLDWRESAGLELLPDVAGAIKLPSVEIARSMIEMRAVIGIDAARRCALRGEPADRAEVARLAELAAAAIGDDQLIDERYAAMWRKIVLGSQNVAYLLAFTSLMRTLDSYREVAAAVRPTDAAAIRTLGAAIEHGAGPAAVAAAEQLLAADE